MVVVEVVIEEHSEAEAHPQPDTPEHSLEAVVGDKRPPLFEKVHQPERACRMSLLHFKF